MLHEAEHRAADLIVIRGNLQEADNTLKEQSNTIAVLKSDIRDKAEKIKQTETAVKELSTSKAEVIRNYESLQREVDMKVRTAVAEKDADVRASLEAKYTSIIQEREIQH